MYNKTLEYVKTFAKFNTTDSASAVRECVFFFFFFNLSFNNIILKLHLCGVHLFFLERFEESLHLHNSRLLK